MIPVMRYYHLIHATVLLTICFGSSLLVTATPSLPTTTTDSDQNRNHEQQFQPQHQQIRRRTLASSDEDNHEGHNNNQGNVPILDEDGTVLLFADDITESIPNINNNTMSVAGPNKESRIIGGRDAAADAYPWMVIWNAGCGATLIYEDIALSAAHCFNPFAYLVRVGSHEIMDGDLRLVTRQVRHPDFDRSTVEYDVMVLKLHRKVTHRRIRLNRDSTNPSHGEQLKVLGFGVTNLEDAAATPAAGDPPLMAETLQEVSVAKIGRRKCNQQYQNQINDALMICAASDVAGKDSCSGDSGGPLLDSIGMQVGIVSFGLSCGLVEYPGVYTRVSAVYDWIQQQICELSDNPPARCGT